MCARKWARVLRLTMSLTMTVPTTSPWSGCRVAVEEGLLGTDAPLLFRQLSTWAHIHRPSWRTAPRSNRPLSTEAERGQRPHNSKARWRP